MFSSMELEGVIQANQPREPAGEAPITRAAADGSPRAAGTARHRQPGGGRAGEGRGCGGKRGAGGGGVALSDDMDSLIRAGLLPPSSPSRRAARRRHRRSVGVEAALEARAVPLEEPRDRGRSSSDQMRPVWRSVVMAVDVLHAELLRTRAAGLAADEAVRRCHQLLEEFGREHRSVAGSARQRWGCCASGAWRQPPSAASAPPPPLSPPPSTSLSPRPPTSSQ